MATIAAISDTHGRHALVDIAPVDILIHCGDACARGSFDELAAVLSWMGQQPAGTRIYVPGNHDFASAQATDDVRRLAADNGVNVLIDQALTTDGITIWGSPWTPTFGTWVWQRPKGEPMAEKWAVIPGDVDVLITHGPPHGHGDKTFWGPRAGCKALLDRVRVTKPRYHLFGHIHEAHGAGWIDGDDGPQATRWFNVANAKLVSRGVRAATLINVKGRDAG